MLAASVLALGNGEVAMRCADGNSGQEMEIIGYGFLARHLAAIAHRHPDTTALAAGGSWGHATSAADFDRERDLVVESASRCRVTGRRLLFFSTSSAAVYPLAGGPGREDTPVTPTSPYGAHKLALEAHLRECGVRFVVLRLSHLVGPGQPRHQLLPTLTRLIRGGRIQVHKGANRDLIAVSDTIKIVDLLLARGVVGETVNVASGVSVAVEDLVAHLELRLGMVADKEHHDGGSSHHVRIDKLLTLVPEAAGFGFGPDYFRAAVDEFVRSERAHA